MEKLIYSPNSDYHGSKVSIIEDMGNTVVCRLLNNHGGRITVSRDSVVAPSVFSQKEDRSTVVGSGVTPYSVEDYETAKKQGLDLDDWDDYVKFYGVGEQPDYNTL